MLTNVKAGGIRCIENKARVWGQSPSRRRPMGLLGDFTAFFQKIAFLGIVCSKFRVFKWLNKVLMRLQGFRPGARASTCLLATLSGRKSKDSIHLLSLLYYGILI